MSHEGSSSLLDVGKARRFLAKNKTGLPLGSLPKGGCVCSGMIGSTAPVPLSQGAAGNDCCGGMEASRPHPLSLPETSSP